MDKQDNSGTPKSPAKQRVYFRRPYNLIHSSNLQKYYQLLCNLNFLLGKIQHPEFGVQALLEDYDLLNDPEATEHPDCNPKAVKALRLIQSGIRLSAHVLVEDPTQLASQLWGRLQDFDLPEIQSLLQQAKQAQKVWLCPLKSSLIPSDGRLIRILSGHRSSVNSIAITPDGKQVVSGSKDGILKVWDLVTGKELFNLTGHRNSVTAVAISPDGKQVISGSEDGIIKVWDLVTRKELSTRVSRKYIAIVLAITLSGKWVISVEWDRTQYSSVSRVSRVSAYLNSLTEQYLDRTSFSWNQRKGNRRIIGWNWETGKEKIFLEDYGLVCAVTLTPDGTRAILHSTKNNRTGPYSSSSDEYDIFQIVDLKSTITEGSLIFCNKTLKKLKNRVEITALSLTPDGKQVVFSSRDNRLRVLDLKSGHELFKFTGHQDEITTVAVSFDSKWAISASKDKTLRIWDLVTGREVSTILEQSSVVNSLVITPNGKQGVSASEDKLIKIWNLEKEEENYSNPTTAESKITQFKIKNDNYSFSLFEFMFALIEWSIMICFCGPGIYLMVWNLFSTMLQPPLSTILQSIWFKLWSCSLFCFLLLPITASVARTFPRVNIVDVRKRSNLNNHNASMATLVVTSDSKEIISGSSDKTLKFWDLETGKELFILTGHQDKVSSVVSVSNNKYIISGSFDRSIKVWNLENFDKTFHLRCWSGIASDALHMTVSGIITVLGSWIFLWIKDSYFILFLVFIVLICYMTTYLTVENNNCLKDGKIVVTSDNKRVIVGSRDKTIKVWDFTSRRQIFTLKGHTDWITCVAVTLDSKYLISGSRDKTLIVWSLRNQNKLFTLAGHFSTVTAVAVTPDGSRAISGSSDSSIKIWDLETRKTILTINGHRDTVEAIAVTPDGKYLVSAASDRTLKVWDLLTGEERTSFTADSPLTCCTVAPEGLTIATGDQAGQLHILRLEGIEASS